MADRSQQRWVAAQGGLLHDSELENRVRHALDELLDTHAESQAGYEFIAAGHSKSDRTRSPAGEAAQSKAAQSRAAVQVNVLATDRCGAYALASGRIYVTRGLLEYFDDQCLMAVLAHELGHLIDDGHLAGVGKGRALHGHGVELDIEMKADLRGCLLLQSQGMDPGVMVRMLRRLEKRATPSLRKHLAMRVRNIETSFAGRMALSSDASIHP